MKPMRFSLLTCGTILALTGMMAGRALAQTTESATASAVATQKDLQQLKIANPVAEIVELNKSGVGDAVILNYIQHSDKPYQLNAQDIIHLRDQGVSTDVTTALIRRGAEQREAAETARAEQNQVAQQQAETETVAAAPTYQSQPVQTVVATPAPVTYYTPVRPTSTVSVHYFGAPRYSYYAAPTYYSHYRNYRPSYYCAPRVSVGVGFGGYRHSGYYSSVRYCR